MQLSYNNEQQSSIKVVLDEGESLGNLAGPVEATVPTDPANTDYAAIVAYRVPVAAYEPPPSQGG